MSTIKSLAGVRFETIYEAFQNAFEDYEMQLNKDELWTMITRRGFVPELSFAAFENDKIIAFTFNGVGIFKGIKTAYDTGTGTCKEYRGQGLATKIFDFSVPFLKETGINQYLLEVLQHNDKAVSVYRKCGFEISREFNYFVRESNELNFPKRELSTNYQLKNIDVKLAEGHKHFCDFEPAWQNSFEAIKRKPEDFKCFGILENNKLRAYAILEPVSGDITQLAVDKDYRRQGLASILCHQLLKFNKHNSIKLINAEIACESLTFFLEKNGLKLSGKQFEMIKNLV